MDTSLINMKKVKADNNQEGRGKSSYPDLNL